MRFKFSGALMVMALVYSSPGHAEEPTEKVASKAIPVKVMAVTPKQVFETRVFTGTTRPVNRAVVRSQISGRVAQMPARLGQRVKQGDLLLELYNPEAVPAVAAAERRWRQAESQLSQRQRDFQRLKLLLKKGTASEQEFEQSQTALETATDASLAAKSEYLSARQLDEERKIAAPFDGVVTAIDTDVGEVVSPGQSLIRVADPTRVELELVVGQTLAQSLKPGDPVEVTLPLLSPYQEGNGIVTATVAEVSPFRERRALPTVRIRFPDHDIQPGVAASAHFKFARGEAYHVPIGALVSNGEGAVLYRVDDNNKAWQVPVQIKTIDQSFAAIDGQIEKGDRVVISGSHRLFDGATVGALP